MQSASDPTSAATELRWLNLSNSQLLAWTDSQSIDRGRKYARQNRVYDLVRTRDGRLLATVAGSDEYVTSVTFTDGALDSVCDCPVDDVGCKHAVAVAICAQQRLQKSSAIPIADPADPRWDVLDLDDVDLSIDERHPTRASDAAALRQFIDGLDRDALASLVFEIAAASPEFNSILRSKMLVSSGNGYQLVNEARSEMKTVLAVEPAYDRWQRAVELPDYRPLAASLNDLATAGMFDEIVTLAAELVSRGFAQLAQCQGDTDDTIAEFIDCLNVVFFAVAHSSMPQSLKLLFLVNCCIVDHLGIISDEVDVIANSATPADWSAVADEVSRRLASAQMGDVAALTDWLIRSLKLAGRDDEAKSALFARAAKTGNYLQLVKMLRDEGDLVAAEDLAIKGVAASASDAPGVAMQLVGFLREIAQRQKRWELVAAYDAWDFFEQPSVEGYRKLLNAADRVTYRDRVREFADEFLRTGIPAVRVIPASNGEPMLEVAEDWPLPKLDGLIPITDIRKKRNAAPRLDMVIDIAIGEKRYAEVIATYHRMCAAVSMTAQPVDPWNMSERYADRVASAVAQTHPHVSLEIYVRQLNRTVPNAGETAYDAVAGYLRKMIPIMRTIGRENDWKVMVADIRQRFKNRPKLMKRLDDLESAESRADRLPKNRVTSARAKSRG